jgi:DNA polymerase elongation subunit (family B)
MSETISKYSNYSEEDLENMLRELKKESTQLFNSQMAIKILMNSLYGAMANKYFLYYVSDMAEGITTSGQLSLKTAINAVNNYLNKVLKTQAADFIIYFDTDSIFVDLSKVVEKTFGTIDIDRKTGEDFLDKVCKTKIETVIREAYEELASTMGAYKNAMSMKREKISDKSIFLASKRYLMNVLNSEGVHYEEPKISVTGIEAVRSSTPDVCRRKMKEAFKVIMNGSEEQLQEFVEDFRNEFYNLPAEQIGKISGTDDIEKYMDSATLYKKGCPIHVRGCIVYNKMLSDMGLNVKYETISSGDKIKFVYLKMPNRAKENIISFPSILPKELGLEDYIDRKMQFEKVFLSPLESILKPIGWSAVKIDTLNGFFV